MKSLKNEKGYSLLLTLVLVLLFSILGASLMAMTFNGVKKNETREHITQAQDLATKGIVRIQKEVNANLKTFPPELSKGMTNAQFESHFNNVIKNFLCASGKKVSYPDESGKGDYSTCIDKVIDLTDSTGSKTKKELVFKSTGTKGNQNAVVYENIEMGADDVQKVLNYTISTIKNNDNGGNIYFHGGSEVTGDLNIEGNIFSTNHGYATSRWAESIYPRLIDSSVNLGDKAYNFKNTPTVNTVSTTPYTQHITGNFQNNYTEIENLNTEGQKLFDSRSNYTISRGAETIKPVDLTQELKKFNPTHSISNSSKLSGTISNNQTTKYNNSLTIEGNNTSVKFHKNIYVKGNLNIGNTSSSNNTYHNINIEGKTIYVEGDVNINKVNLEASFTLFATGKVNITFTTVSGIKEGKVERGSLIVFADGNLSLSNLADYSDSSNVINGFFYSSQTVQLFGFISNTEIVGGVAGSNVVLNSLRGKSKDRLSSWDVINKECFLWFCNTDYRPYQEIGGNYYETRQTQLDINKTPSRLKIKYNDDLLDTYRNSIDFSSSVIYPDNVLPPLKKDRSYEAP